MGSRGSVIPFFNSIKDTGTVPITDPKMTRFMISLEEGVELVWHAFEDMVGGEIYVKKIPSMVITDLAEAVAPGAEQKVVGIRPGEKLHEQMIGLEDAASTFEYDDYYKILPVINNWSDDVNRIKGGIKVDKDFSYDSSTNTSWMSVAALQDWIKRNAHKLGKL
jgi:FlaA1/EpsC-like NDP-sugar epimerase